MLVATMPRQRTWRKYLESIQMLEDMVSYLLQRLGFRIWALGFLLQGVELHIFKKDEITLLIA